MGALSKPGRLINKDRLNQNLAQGGNGSNVGQSSLNKGGGYAPPKTYGPSNGGVPRGQQSRVQSSTGATAPTPKPSGLDAGYAANPHRKPGKFYNQKEAEGQAKYRNSLRKDHESARVSNLQGQHSEEAKLTQGIDKMTGANRGTTPAGDAKIALDAAKNKGLTVPNLPGQESGKGGDTSTTKKPENKQTPIIPKSVTHPKPPVPTVLALPKTPGQQIGIGIKGSKGGPGKKGPAAPKPKPRSKDPVVQKYLEEKRKVETGTGWTMKNTVRDTKGGVEGYKQSKRTTQETADNETRAKKTLDDAKAYDDDAQNLPGNRLFQPRAGKVAQAKEGLSKAKENHRIRMGQTDANREKHALPPVEQEDEPEVLKTPKQKALKRVSERNRKKKEKKEFEDKTAWYFNGEDD